MELGILWTIIGVIGSIASIYGAYHSLKSKKDAQSAAELAESVKNQIISKQNTTELGEIFYHSQRLQKTFVKYSTAQTQNSLSGVDFNSDANDLREFISKINENRSLLDKCSDIDATRVYDSFNQLLTEYSSDNKIKNKQEKGKQIILKIDNLIFELKKAINYRNEQTE
jgi:hypothetical protein